MPVDLRVTIDGEVIEIDTEKELADLTGEETLAIEDFLGGWQNFDRRSGSARSVYVLYWLARRSKDPKVKLDDVKKEKGILFGDRMELDDLDADGKPIEYDEEGNPKNPPAEAADEAATPSTTPDGSETSGTGT